MDEVLAFWFGGDSGEPGDPGDGAFRDAWFEKDPAFDSEVADRFGGLYEEAAGGDLDGWKEDARGCLALVILLDQFPRNMFRGDPRAHATDAAALDAARYAVDRALDRELPAFGRMFLYMPFMHSEDAADQRRSVDLFDRLAREPGAPDVSGYAVGHKEIVDRFGRFPHRNAVLGRETAPEEAEFLGQPRSSY